MVPEHLRIEVLLGSTTAKTQDRPVLLKQQLSSDNTFFYELVDFLTYNILNCSSCPQDKPIKHATANPPIVSFSTDQCFPGNLSQNDSVEILRDPAGITFALTAKSDFLKYLFAIYLRYTSSPIVAKQLLRMFLRTNYISFLLGTFFASLVKQKHCYLPDVNLDYVTVKHLQTIGSFERKHASLKQFLGIYENEIERG